MFPLRPGDWRFPPVSLASPEGLLAIGGDLDTGRLLEAYRRGIFPWYNPGEPILWWSPDPRAVLHPDGVHVSHSLRKALRRRGFTVTLDGRFREVITACAGPRRGRPGGGTWITPAMTDAYCRLHELGYAHSVEVWRAGGLAGGLYGVALGGAFFGESMFSRDADASKVALVCLARQIARWGYSLIDCQLPSEHLSRLGARAVRRADFLEELAHALAQPGRRGPWRLDPDLALRDPSAPVIA